MTHEVVKAPAADEYAAEVAAASRLRGASWEPVDLTPYLSGTWKPVEPMIGERTDGARLFYPGKIHSIAAETESGKTWLALAAAHDVMIRDQNVLYLDFEDQPQTAVFRLLAMGVTRETIESRFHYASPESAVDVFHYADLIERLSPALVVVDGVTDALSRHQGGSNSGDDYSLFKSLVLDPPRDRGAAVVVLDHVSKSSEGRGRYAIGTVHKINSLDGAGYTLTTLDQAGVGATGRSRLYVTKDRPGSLRKHGLPTKVPGMTYLGDLVMESHGPDFMRVTVTPPISPPSDEQQAARDDAIRARIHALLSEQVLTSKNQIHKAIGGSKQYVLDAVDGLVADGYLSTKYRVLKPYEQGGA